MEELTLVNEALSDLDGDGTWNRASTMPAQASETNIIAILIGLVVSRGGEELTYRSLIIPAAPGQVVDAQSGQPIPGAKRGARWKKKGSATPWRTRIA